MKKLKILTSIVLSLALISPSFPFISRAEENIVKDIKEVDITWGSEVRDVKSSLEINNESSVDLQEESNITENIMVGKFDISSIYETGSKVYLGAQDVVLEKINLNLNDKDVYDLEFKKSDNMLDEAQENYYIAEITNNLEGNTTGVITVSKDVYDNYKLEKMKAIVYKEIVIEANQGAGNGSSYIPKFPTDASTTEDQDEDTYPLKLDWTKTKPNYWLADSTKFKVDIDRFNNNNKILPDNTYTGNERKNRPLEIPDLIQKSSGSYYDYYLDYRSLLSYIEPTESVEWEKDNKGVLLDKWNHTANNTSKASWRMHRGAFKLTQSQLNDIKNGDMQLFLGIKNEDDKSSTILGVNDYLSVLVNGQMTDINVSTSQPGYMNLITYNSDAANATRIKNRKKLKTEVNADKSYPGDKCYDPNHEIGKNPNTVDGWHIHLNDLAEGTDTSSSAALLGDITNLVYDANKTDAENLSKVNRLEMLTGEFNGVGGVTKLEVYCVKKPKIKAEKTAYIVEDNQVKELDQNQSASPGDNLYFKFGMENFGKVEVNNNIHFADYNTRLGINVYIDKNGVYKTNEKYERGNLIYGLDKLSVKKYSKNESGNWIEKDKNQPIKDKLSSLKPGEKIEVTSKVYDNPTITINNDVFLYTVKDEDIKNPIKNTVRVGYKYMNKNLFASADASISINITEAKIELAKMIVSVNNKEPQIENDMVVANPGDTVKFKITMTNKKDSVAQELSLEDILKLKDTTQTEKWDDVANIEWKFYSDPECTNEITDLDKFSIEANKTRSIYTTYEIDKSQEIGSIFKNVATLYQTLSEENKMKVASAEVDFIVKANHGSLRFKKVVELNENKADDQKFTVNIKGSDESEYNILLKPGDEETLNGLKQGVTYTIEEKVVPMNYENTDISFEYKGNGVTDEGKVIKVTLTPDTDAKLVTISNKKVNGEGLFDKGYIKNVFKYVKDTIEGGMR